MITPAFGLTATERVLPKLALDWTTGLAQSGVDVTRAGVATFVGSNGFIQSATANTQRVDWSTGTAGLLIEESRINQIKYSEQFENAVWTTLKSAGASVVADTTVAPDGNTTADSVTFATSSDYLYQSILSYPAVTGNVIVFSVYAKTSTQIIFFGGGSPTGTDTYSYVEFNNGWYRQILKRVFTETTSLKSLQMLPFAGSVGAGTFPLWGAQLEAGAFATSFIPTVAATVTRNADVATMTGANFSSWFNASEGSLACWFNSFIPSGTVKGIISVGSVPNNYIDIRTGSTLTSVMVNNGSQQTGLDTIAYAAGTNYKFVTSYKANNCVAASNATLSSVDTVATIPTCDTLYIGSTISLIPSSGHFQKVLYWPQRLINNEVQAFSK